MLDIGASMQKCKSLGTRIQTHIDPDALVAGGLAEARHSLSRLATACEHLVAFTGSADALPNPELLARNYTMSAERDVHDQVLNGASPAEVAAAPARPAGDLGDNIELF